MEAKDIGLVALTLATLISLGYIALDENPTHYCESREITAECESLSDSGITCYRFGNSTSKRCSEGWIEIGKEAENEDIIIKVLNKNGKNWECRAIKGELKSNTMCWSDKGTNTYLGELI